MNGGEFTYGHTDCGLNGWLMILRWCSQIITSGRCLGSPLGKLEKCGEGVCGSFSNMSKTIGTPIPRG
jgi:hypothetical protein